MPDEIYKPKRGQKPKHDYAKITAAVAQVAPTRERALRLNELCRRVEPICGKILPSSMKSILTRLCAAGKVSYDEAYYGFIYWVEPKPDAPKVEV